MAATNDAGGAAPAVPAAPAAALTVISADPPAAVLTQTVAIARSRDAEDIAAELNRPATKQGTPFHLSTSVGNTRQQ